MKPEWLVEISAWKFQTFQNLKSTLRRRGPGLIGNLRTTTKNFVANEHHSFTSVFTFSVVVVDLPTDCILRRGTLGGTQYRNTVRKNGKYRNTASKIV